MSFGNAVAIDVLRTDASLLQRDAFVARLGNAFLLVHTLDIGGDAKSSTTNVVTDSLPVPAAAASVPAAPPPVVVYFVRRAAASQFDWIAVGRHGGNDVVIPHKSISRFHAFFRFIDNGVVLSDAKSQNGTFVGDVRAPRGGEGEPLRLTSGMSLRFGDVSATFLDAEGMSALLTRTGAGAPRPSP